MSTLFYAPGVRVLIATNAHGTLDVTDDITEGSLALNANAPHKLGFTLSNHRRKYDGVFMPNDRIVCRLKRINWLQVFAGYLDQVPFFTVYPTDVKIEATCTMKRIQYHYWDPGANDTVAMLRAALRSADNLDQNVLTGGMTKIIVQVLTDVVGWQKDAIHIGRIPTDWVNKVDEVWAKLSPGWSVPPGLLGLDPTINGVAASHLGTETDPSGVGKGYGALPVGSGTIVTTTEGRTGQMVVSGERRDHPQDEWWCAMRWPFAQNESGDPAADISQDERITAIDHWKRATVVVVNPANGKSIILRPADWGPTNANAVIGMSDAAAASIGATAGTMVIFGFGALGAVVGQPAQVAASTTATEVKDLGFGGTLNPIAGLAPNSTAASSVTWAEADHLKANVRAARDFIFANWPDVTTIGGWRPSDPYPDHPSGHALDVMMTNNGTAATGDRKSLGNSVAMWFMANPGVFGLQYVIWYARKANVDVEAGAWRPYTSAADQSPNQLHMNHVHLTFKDGITSAGAPGTAMAGSAPNQFEGGFSSIGPAGGANLLQTQNWDFDTNPLSTTLAGDRALLNDTNVFDDFSTYVDTSMRNFCSAPNGDFIAWFPDYFGLYGTAGKLELRAIEMQDWGMAWSDRYLITHQFTAGTVNGAGSIYAEQSDLRMEMTSGIASVEHPEIMEALLNVSADDGSGWTSPDVILQRFGARPKFNTMSALSATNPKAEFWYALSLFQKNWASQFSARIPMTFMPELFPGMLLVLPDYHIQFYVESVTHSWNLRRGGGFYTDASVIAPSATDGQGFKGLVRGGIK